MSKQDSSSNSERRVLRFPGARSRGAAQAQSGPPPENLTKYQGGREDPAEYRHRMRVNAAAFLFVLGLIGAAIWLADSMAKMRKDQDCVLSGRRGCSPVEVNIDRR